MHSTSVRVVAFLGVCLMLGAVVIFRNQIGSLVNPGDRFAEAAMLMQKLQSSALYAGTLTDAQLDLLKTERQNSETRIVTLTKTISDDIVRAKAKIPTVAQQTSIIDDFTLRSPRSVFNSGIDEKLGTLKTDTALKSLLNSINIQVNDKNIRNAYIVWYDEFFATVCTTNDPNNDLTVKGTVTFASPSVSNIVDRCEGSSVVQTQCLNRQKGSVLTTTCPNGCSNGTCLDAPVTSFKGFTITIPATVTVNTLTDITIEAIKNDNSRDTSYNKSVIILIDGDPQAMLPLANITLVNGVKQIPQALKFAQAGSVIVAVKDIESGTETSKNITVTDIDQTCAGTRPANTTIVANINTTSQATQTWTYSANTSGPSTSCTYTCANGYTYNNSTNECVATVTPHCTGEKPAHSTVLSDVGTVNKTWEYNAGTGAAANFPKCSYKCETGYHIDGTSCVADTHSAPQCTGTPPAHTVTLLGVGTVDKSWEYNAGTVTPYPNCSYKCDTGFNYQNGNCVADVSCTGVRPANTTILSDVGAVNRPWTYAASGPASNCSYTCANGYSYDATNGTCIATVTPHCLSEQPAHSTLLSGIGTASASKAWEYNAGTSAPYPNCSFKCEAGYHNEGNLCVVDSLECTGMRPANTTVLSPVGTVNKAWEYNAGTTTPYPNCSYKCSTGYHLDGTSCVADAVCPPYTPMTASQCVGGTIVNTNKDANNCQLADTCVATTYKGTVRLTTLGKNCWFGSPTRKITLSEFKSYHLDDFMLGDEVYMWGDTAPTTTSVNIDMFGYSSDENNWKSYSASQEVMTSSSVFSQYFYFRTADPNTSQRQWNIPADGINFYGCYEDGLTPTRW